MGKVLIAYTTSSGSTEEVAQVIGEELTKGGAVVEVRRLEDVASLEGYDAAIVGAPMILGWSRGARRFIKKHERALAQIPVAYFCTAMSLTQTNVQEIAGVKVCVDPELAQPPRRENQLSLKERYATVENYLSPMLKSAPTVHPVSIGVFGGKLELFRLKILPMLFVMAVIQAQPGDLRNWPFIRGWAADLQSGLLGVKSQEG